MTNAFELTSGNLQEGARAVLVIDDEKPTLRAFQKTLQANGYPNVIVCHDSRDVNSILQKHAVAAVLLDMEMPYLSGADLLPMISEEHPEIPVIIITGTDEVETAVSCIKMGAFDYLTKPVKTDRFLLTLRRALELRELREEHDALRENAHSDGLENPEAFFELITVSPEMFTLFQYVEAIGRSEQPVLITGETGVGKELFARAIHRVSGRSGPFLPVNVAGLDDNLFSDALFGHARGAYTGADSDRAGLIEKAVNGTLFLDEIGDLNSSSQIKLLRLLQEREYLPLGANALKRSDARIVLATNCDLEALKDQGQFRKDLYFRLRTHHVHIPPLRDRTIDLPLLLNHFMERAANELGVAKPTHPPQLVDLLSAYAFPGNLRELESIIFDAVSRHRSGILSAQHFRQYIKSNGGETSDLEDSHSASAERLFANHERLPTLKSATQALIAEALRRANGNQTVASDLIGMTRTALNKRLTRANK